MGFRRCYHHLVVVDLLSHTVPRIYSISHLFRLLPEAPRHSFVIWEFSPGFQGLICQSSSLFLRGQEDYLRHQTALL